MCDNVGLFSISSHESSLLLGNSETTYLSSRIAMDRSISREVIAFTIKCLHPFLQFFLFYLKGSLAEHDTIFHHKLGNSETTYLSSRIAMDMSISREVIAFAIKCLQPFSTILFVLLERKHS